MDFSLSPPTVMHIDINSCFATIEQQANPLLRGKPIVVAAYTTGALAINNGVMVIRATVIRTGAATQDILVTASSNNALLTTALLSAYTTATETLSGAVTVRFTGEGTDTDDIIQKIMTVKFYPVNS